MKNTRLVGLNLAVKAISRDLLTNMKANPKIKDFSDFPECLEKNTTLTALNVRYCSSLDAETWHQSFQCNCTIIEFEFSSDECVLAEANIHHLGT